MDYKFLNKVLDQLVSETSVDFNLTQDRWVSIFTPMVSYPIFSSQPTEQPFTKLFHYPMFETHCKEVYGLNDDEIEYVWKEYKQIIKDKIDNGL